MKKICIINYQAGNIKSLSNALMRCGYAPVVSADPEIILSADLAILPGVGAFGDAVEALKDTGLWDVLHQRFALGRPLIGICLGMQLFFEDSDELALTEGFGWMKGQIRRLSPDSKSLKVPHMGWNQLEGKRSGWTYFVHSYGLVNMDEAAVVAYCDHGQKIPAIVDNAYECGTEKGRLIGFQFHPEKSGVFGEVMLRTAIEEVFSQ